MTVTYVLGAPLGVVSEHRRLVDLGPDHPSRSGVVEIVCRLDGGVIQEAEIRPGASHRSAEKLFEVRDYRAVLALANRHDWQAPFAGELGAALTIEEALRLTPPPRATWLRTVLAEHARLHSHLGFLSVIPAKLAPDVALAYRVHAAREALREQLADLSGNRVHPMVCRLGGLSVDADQQWLEAETQLAETIHELASELRTLLVHAGLPDGVAVIGADLARAYGITGPAARAAGVDTDLRRHAPYLAYAELAASGALRRVTRTTGDCYARFEVLADQVDVSLDVADACLDRLESLPPGPINVRLPKVVKAPEGHTYAWTENPLGINGYYLVSRGEKTPWRLKLRSASFNNVQVLPELLQGALLADMVAVLGSMFFVVGDVDK